MAIKIGKPAPDFSAKAYVKGLTSARDLSLSEFRGKWVVLFFYPRDFTFVCPTEILAFAERQKDFEKERSVIIGASTDSVYSHKAWFETDQRLKEVEYPIMADTTHEVSRAYDVLREETGDALRGTFIIDPNGVLRHAMINDTDVGRSIEETLRTLQALRTGKLCPAGWEPGQATLN